MGVLIGPKRMESCVSLMAAASVDAKVASAAPTMMSLSTKKETGSVKQQKPARVKKVPTRATNHRSGSESPSSASFPSSEDGSSEVVAPAMVAMAVKKLRTEEMSSLQTSTEPVFECGAPAVSDCLFTLDDDIYLGPMSMVMYDEGLLPEGIF